MASRNGKLTGTPEQWARVGEEVSRARGTRFDQHDDRYPPSHTIWSRIENGNQTGADRYTLTQTLAQKICQSLDWTDDSIQRILDGGAPLPRNGAKASDPAVGGAEWLADLIAELGRHQEELVAIIGRATGTISQSQVGALDVDAQRDDLVERFDAGAGPPATRGGPRRR